MNNNKRNNIYKVKNGPTLKANVTSLTNEQTNLSGGADPVLYKHTSKTGAVTYHLFVAQYDIFTEFDWLANWPSTDAEAILNYSQRGRNDDPSYITEHAVCCRDDRTRCSEPGEYSIEDFEPQPLTDELSGYELYKCTVTNVRPDEGTVRHIIERGTDAGFSEEFIQGCKNLIARIEKGDDMTIKSVTLPSVPAVEVTESYLVDQLEDMFGGCPIMYDSVTHSQRFSTPKAPMELPSWAWSALEVYDHSGLAWHLYGDCVVDRNWDVSTGVGYFYLTKEKIAQIEEEASKVPENEKYAYKRNQFLRTWHVFCKPVLDGDWSEAIIDVKFDENGELLEAECVWGGLYYETYKFHENAKKRPLCCLADFAKSVMGDPDSATVEDITADLMVRDDYKLPTV